MEQYQPFEEWQSTISQSITNIYSHFENIKGQVNDEFPEIPKKSTVLIFLGEFGKKFDEFYAHFEKKQVIQKKVEQKLGWIEKKEEKQDKIYYKLVEIEKNGKISYLLNFPLILSYDDINDQIAYDLCISKIYAEMAFKKMETCNFYLILDISQLKGDDDKGKLDNVFYDSIFFFGTYYFNENNFFLLKFQEENNWDYQQFTKSNGFFSFFSNNQQCITQTLSQNSILEQIFQSDNSIKIEQVKSEDFINYGKMMTYLQKQYKDLKEQCNHDLQNFQKLLLQLQQMPIIKNNQNVIQEVKQYLEELDNRLNKLIPPLTDNASLIGTVYQFICKVNNGQNAQNINERLKDSSSVMNQFLKDNNLKQLSIKPLLSNDLIYKLNRIIQFFQKYHNSELKNDKICEVQKLKLNLKQWCSYCNETLENTLYDLKYIAKRIQKGPEIEMENGIYFIGITRVGKSTIINSLLNPDNIVQKEFVTQECYGIKMETKFKIGEGGVSETQKISGVYIGKKEKLNQIFQQEEEQSVFSLDEILDKDQIQKCKIPQNWFIFDCPGFDDNNNELMRIAHRISLYNYFSKTKNIIVFLVIDISSQQIENIKNTFDPIRCLLQDTTALEVHFEEWTSIILTKGNEGQRQIQLEENNWKKTYQGNLEQNYSFYKKLFANNNRCIEFQKPQNNITENIKKLTESIIKTQQNYLEKAQRIIPQFQLVLDEKVWMLYQNCISKAKLKLEHIINFFLEDLDAYILESDDYLQVKQEQIEKIKNSLLNQSTQQMIKVITQDNCQIILQALSNWIKHNKYLKNNDFFLQIYIDDMESILEISKYCKKQNKVINFEVKIDNLANKITTILQKIEETIQYYRNWKYTGYAASLITGIMTCGTSLALLEVSVVVNLARQFLLTRGALWVATLGSGSLTASTGLGSVCAKFENWKNQYLKKLYQNKLDKQKRQEKQYKLEQQQQQQKLEQQQQQQQQQAMKKQKQIREMQKQKN